MKKPFIFITLFAIVIFAFSCSTPVETKQAFAFSDMMILVYNHPDKLNSILQPKIQNGLLIWNSKSNLEVWKNEDSKPEIIDIKNLDMIPDWPQYFRVRMSVPVSYDPKWVKGEVVYLRLEYLMVEYSNLKFVSTKYSVTFHKDGEGILVKYEDPNYGRVAFRDIKRATKLFN